MTYRIILLPKAIEDLSKLDKPTSLRITDKLTWLSENIEVIMPIPLKGHLSQFYKLKTGDWRIIYDIDSAQKVIAVHRIGHRSEIYR
jgi:mRNA interferase RelE/StbE